MKRNTSPFDRSFWTSLGILAFVGGATAAIAYWFRQRRRDIGYDRQFTGAFPRNSGAISAVTGGSPEDMNGMPAATGAERPIYDGSQLTH